ncbi:hypothetical protein QBC44DRAFT_318398 [Cladorrhinum sp. PSN332]|nr:hypothetical protein QBC44DRAFT_318398 [Cladorrhinum sp. PSN332]
MVLVVVMVTLGSFGGAPSPETPGVMVWVVTMSVTVVHGVVSLLRVTVYVALTVVVKLQVPFSPTDTQAAAL